MAERPNAANRPVAKRPLADTNSVVSRPAAESGMKSLLGSLFVFARISFPKSEGSHPGLCPPPQSHSCPPSPRPPSAAARRRTLSLQPARATRIQSSRSSTSPSRTLPPTKSPPRVRAACDPPPPPWRGRPPGPPLPRLCRSSTELPSRRRWLWRLLNRTHQVARGRRCCPRAQRRSRWKKSRRHLWRACGPVCRGWRSRGSAGMEVGNVLDSMTI